MNSVDIGILVILSLSSLIGLFRGFTREVLGMFTWLGAAVLAYLTLSVFSGFTKQYITNPMMADIITGVVLFILYLIVFSIVSSFIAATVHSSALGGVDRALGFSFGIIRGVVFLLIAEVVISSFIPRTHQPQAIQTARFAPMIRSGGDALFRTLPGHWQQYIIAQITKSLEAAKVAESVIQQSGTPAAPNTTPPLPLGQTPAPTPTPQQQSLLKQEEDTEKTAESLANLKPQSVPSKTHDGEYDNRQRREMERLFQTTE